MFLKNILLVIYIATTARCADILAIVPTPSFSHQVAFFDFWNQLSLRGHKVTLITTNPQKNNQLTNFTEIDMKWTYKFIEDLGHRAENTMTMWNMLIWIHEFTSNVSKAQLSDHRIQELIHHKKHFDVILLESFYTEYLGFAEVYNCPVIIVSSLDIHPGFHDRVGNSAHPALYPNLWSCFYTPLSFKERVVSSIYTLYSSLYDLYGSIPQKEKEMQRVFNTTTSLNQLMDNVDMLFLNVNPVIQTPRAVGPTTINIGGLRANWSKQILAKDLLEFLNNATTGFIYFSLGSNVKSKDLQKESLNAIVETLGELPYKVLWKFEADAGAVLRKPDNVKLIKWAPQLGVLAHPNIKVFVTQGGLQSMEESLYNEVPTVVIPFFADQQQNAKLMQSKGISVMVGRHPYIMKEELKSAILEVINNPSYKSSVSNLKRLALDTPMSGLEKAIWWTEYVIRNKGAKHLRNPAADLPVYQYYLLDVIGFLVTVSVVIISILVFLFRRIYSLAIVLISLGKRSDLHKKSQ